MQDKGPRCSLAAGPIIPVGMHHESFVEAIKAQEEGRVIHPAGITGRFAGTCKMALMRVQRVILNKTGVDRASGGGSYLNYNDAFCVAKPRVVWMCVC